MEQLTNEHASEICQTGRIPSKKCRKFIDAIQRSVEEYRRMKAARSASDVVYELDGIAKLASSALRMDGWTDWRPSLFRTKLGDLHRRLERLSPEATALLEYRRAPIALSKPKKQDRFGLSPTVVSPAVYDSVDEQLVALERVVEAMSGHEAGRSRGQPRKYAERILFSNIAQAYTNATQQRADDSVPHFMDAAAAIKRIYGLDEWSPQSIARLLRKDRQEEKEGKAI